MSAPAVLIAALKIRPGHEDDFVAWQVRHNAVVSKFPGFISGDLIPPAKSGDNEWTLLLNFQSEEQLTQWQKSGERAKLIGEMTPLVEGGTMGQLMEKEGVETGVNITQVILSRVRSGMEEPYRAWAVRMQQAQSQYPGYRGMYLQPPSTPGEHWTTLLRYDTQEHLEKWLAAPERARLLEEARPFILDEEFLRLATSFPGWIPIRPVDGQSPPGWKLAMLVLLGLFPIVMLEMRFLNPQFQALELNNSLAIFLGNLLSVGITSFITIPLFVRWFSWWLFLKKESCPGTTTKGVVILLFLFVTEVAVFWRLL